MKIMTDSISPITHTDSTEARNEAGNNRPQPLSVVIIGDPHYKTKNIVETTEFELKLFAYLDGIVAPTFIVCTGDMLNDHETVHSDPLRRIISLVHRLRRYAPVYVLVGNHDRPNNSNFLTEEHPFTAIKHWDCDLSLNRHAVTVVDRVIVDVIAGHRLVWVPYVPPGRFFEALMTAIKPTEDNVTAPVGSAPSVVSPSVVSPSAPVVTGPKGRSAPKVGSLPSAPNQTEWRAALGSAMTNITAIFSHQEFYGVPLSADTTSVNGDRWPLDYPTVFNGHIHDYSQPQPNIYNVGTPFQQTFGEREDKTISLVTVTTQREITHQRVDLHLTKKRTIHLTVNEVVTFVPPPGYHLKIVIVGTSSELKQAGKLYQVKALIDLGVKVVYSDSGEADTRSRRTPPKLTVVSGNIQNNVSFARRLHNKISGDPNLKLLFNELFGAPTISNPRLRVVPSTKEIST
jgi:hypothetical protein